MRLGTFSRLLDIGSAPSVASRGKNGSDQCKKADNSKMQPELPQKKPLILRTRVESPCRKKRFWPGSLDDMTTTTVLAIIVPVEVLLIALFAGIPLWLVIKHPDQRPRPALAVPRQRRAHAAA